MKTLRETLNDWCDQDGAAYLLAISLGLMPEGIFSRSGKHVFWSNSPVGNILHNFLIEMVKAGILEEREAASDTQFRWNPAFQGTWE